MTTCPFCESPVEGPVCAACGRDPRAVRRLCSHCGGMTPSQESVCCRCGTPFRSDLAWKVPLIIFLFIVVIILSVLVQVYIG